MEIRKLKETDYDELLEMLNTVFANQHKHPMDFLNELPKMWVRDDKHMGYHTGLFEDGKLVSVAGCYPFTVRIGDTSLLFATTGNVATLPAYEGRGYFTTIFTEIMKELERMGADVARLGGARHRYKRFGYEPAGSSYVVTLNTKNRLHCFQDAGQDIVFREVEQADTTDLGFCDRLSRRAEVYVERSVEENYRDVYLALCSKHAAPYLALRNGIPIGYLAAAADEQYVGRSENGRHILELRYEKLEYFIPMVCAWQRHVGKDITFKLAPHMMEELRLVVPGAEGVSLLSPSRFRILNYEKLADALIKLKYSHQSLLPGELILGIEEYGAIKLQVGAHGAGCARTEETPEITLDKPAATRLLFGHVPPSAVLPAVDPLWNNWFPLPLSWNTLDYV